MAAKNKFFNDIGTGVDKFIYSGRTSLFYDKASADTFAKQKRSYVYEIYDNKGNFYAYGVPK